MRHHTIIIATMITLTSLSSTARTCSDDLFAIHTQFLQVQRAYMYRDAQVLLDHTFPPLIEAAGGREILRARIEQMQQKVEPKRTVILSVNAVPETPQKVGGLNVCILRVDSREEDLDTRNVKYYFAMLPSESIPKWTFMEAQPYAKDRTLLDTILPGYPQSVRIPNNEVDVK